MIFHKRIEEAYKAQLYRRCDDTGFVSYFSYEDFPGLSRKPYLFYSSKGHKMQGYFYAYDHADKHRLVVFEHGFGGGHRSYMREIEMLCRHGFYVFAYDHTGCMESGGEGCNGWAQSLCDLDDCINALRSDGRTDTSDISVIGHSWGGYSTLNICRFHKDVKRIVVLSGFVSVRKVVAQNFKGMLSLYRNDIFSLEKRTNPSYVECDAVESLKGGDTKALLIYSDNDPLVDRDVHWKALKDGLEGEESIKLILVEGKGHNVNYTHEAVEYLATLMPAINANKHLTGEAEKKAFRNSFDWMKMTEQDEEIWKEIFDLLDK